MFENCKKNGPPSPSSKRTSPPVLLQLSNKSGDVRKLQEDWSPIFENCKKTGPPVLLQFSNKNGVFENCKKTGPTSVVAVFERSKTARRMVPPCSKTATMMVHFVRNLQEHRSECSKTARTLVHHVRKLQQQRSPMFEKCKNTGGKMFENCARV